MITIGIRLLLLISCSIFSIYGFAEEKKSSAHDHEEAEQDHHEGEDDASAGDEHGEEETPESVGPNKGVTSYSEKEGFTLSAEATKTFGITTVELSGSAPWDLPISAILQTGSEKSVYRLNKGALKRIDISISKKSKTQATINSNKLASGDQIVVTGISYIRTAEIDLTSGDSGHHH
ncbi:MAG: hypothetical protein SGJ18_00805 [Pseudomonadota bacterium]|nr:hypothetical protein [Pseudomonadota bacterium]